MTGSCQHLDNGVPWLILMLLCAHVLLIFANGLSAVFSIDLNTGASAPTVMYTFGLA